jgi:hypothetical protein
MRLLNGKKMMQVSEVVNPLGHRRRAWLDRKFAQNQLLPRQRPRSKTSHMLAH